MGSFFLLLPIIHLLRQKLTHTSFKHLKFLALFPVVAFPVLFVYHLTGLVFFGDPSDTGSLIDSSIVIACFWVIFGAIGYWIIQINEKQTL